MSAQVKAEILLATYNGEAYLRELLDSLLAQTDARWHLTASDDGSADSTPDILEEYARRYPDRITLHRAGRRFGCARDHFLYLMRRCEAAYMLFCDQDDVWQPDKVEKTLCALLDEEKRCGRETPVLVFSDLTPVDAELRPIAASLMRLQRQNAHERDYRALLLQNVVTGCTMGINRALARMAGRCLCDGDVIMHDGWLAAVAARFGCMAYLDESTVLYRQHGQNSVGAKDVKRAGYLADRIWHIKKTRSALLAKKRQAAVFLRTYQTQLDDQDERFLSSFIRDRSGIAFYWRHRQLIEGVVRLGGWMLLG